MTTVGERIRERRVALGLSLRDLACEGVSYAYVRRLEANERQPSVKALRADRRFRA
jgi:transcriptional regulator with XRE-family HTH domain